LSAFDNTLRRIGRDLHRLKVPWALVGGVAVSTRGAPRFTNDIDVAVLVAADADRERFVARLLEAGYRVETLLEDKETGELVTVRLLCPEASGTQFMLDLLFATSGLEAEVVRAAARIDVTLRINLPVASIAHLIAMKVLSAGGEGRSRDADDLARLIPRATDADLTEARRALALITERGRNRGKDLQSEFDRYLRRFRPGSS
jgi:hypothetical protein